MGNRRKLIYQQGRLRDALSNEVLREWSVKSEVIVPNRYAVLLELSNGKWVQINEDEQGVWLREEAKKQITGTSAPLRLPTFADHAYSEILRVLHHEILINIVDAKPLPNFFVYDNPWRRDAAMMAMCLKKTGNIDLIKDWVLSLDDPFDHNNGRRSGWPEDEADNLGQTLYLLSFFQDASHPFVDTVLSAAQRFTVVDSNDRYIRGRSDFQKVPVYQSKWLKFGLKSLALPDDYVVPALPDNYSSLFWWDFKEDHISGDEWVSDHYPYIGWARDHFYGRKGSPISDQDYPLTWETEASEANYDGMATIDSLFTKMKSCTPHTWHAAEVFLYLLDH